MASLLVDRRPKGWFCKWTSVVEGGKTDTRRGKKTKTDETKIKIHNTYPEYRARRRGDENEGGRFGQRMNNFPSAAVRRNNLTSLCAQWCSRMNKFPSVKLAGSYYIIRVHARTHTHTRAARASTPGIVPGDGGFRFRSKFGAHYPHSILIYLMGYYPFIRVSFFRSRRCLLPRRSNVVVFSSSPHHPNHSSSYLSTLSHNLTSPARWS